MFDCSSSRLPIITGCSLSILDIGEAKEGTKMMKQTASFYLVVYLYICYVILNSICNRQLQGDREAIKTHFVEFSGLWFVWRPAQRVMLAPA